MSSKHIARIDRAAFDRVLRRAAELQAGSRDVGEDGMTEAEVLALGQEVGLAEPQLRQALLEERVRATPLADPGFLDRVIAPAEFQAERVVQGTPESVGAALSRWLEYHEHLMPQRMSTGVLTFEPLQSFAGAMRRMRAAFDSGRGKSYLDHAELVTAIVTSLEDGFCHVTLSASLRKRRAAFVGGGIGLASVGLAGSLILGVVGTPLLVPLIPLVPTLAGGYAIARGYRPAAASARVGLERALDALERAPALPPTSGSPGTPGAMLGREMGQVVREFTKEVRKALDK